MITVQGTVKNGVVKLPATVKLSDGSRVMITILESINKPAPDTLSRDIEAEDVDFVRACRGRLAKQLREDDE
jgi:hypothetical protein